MLVTFVSAEVAGRDSSRRWRWIAAAAVAVSAAAIVLSGTRSAMLGLAAGGLYWLVRFRARLRPVRVAACLGAAAAAVTLFYFSGAGAQLRSRVHWALEDARGGARLLLWRDTLRMAERRPLAGYGPETFSAEFPRFQSVDLARAYPDFYHESPHNVFLDALAEQGAPGLAVLLGLCVLGFRAARRPGAGALGAALAGLLVSQLFTSFVLVTALYTFVLLALLVAEDAPPAPARRVALAAALPVSCALAALAAMFAVSDRNLALASQDLDAGRPDAALREYERARRWQPGGGASDLWYSRRLALFAQTSTDAGVRLRAWQQALNAAVRATRTAEDRANAWFSLAAFAASGNDYSGTEAALLGAIARAPNWYKPHWLLARVWLAAGRRRQAEQEAETAARLNGGKHPEVELTLAQIRATRPVTPP